MNKRTKLWAAAVWNFEFGPLVLVCSFGFGYCDF
jgi:hypothetical protein